MTVEAPPGLGRLVMGELMSRPDFVEKMANAISGALDATVAVWDKGARAYDIRPDFRTRMDAWKAAMAYGEGLPLQRIMAATMSKALGGDDLAKQMADSPAFLEYVERELAKARDGQRFSRAQKARMAETPIEAKTAQAAG